MIVSFTGPFYILYNVASFHLVSEAREGTQTEFRKPEACRLSDSRYRATDRLDEKTIRLAPIASPAACS